MSTEMVACIAVESISILEKMHSRGYDWCCIGYFFFHVIRSLSFAHRGTVYTSVLDATYPRIADGILSELVGTKQVCTWRCEA